MPTANRPAVENDGTAGRPSLVEPPRTHEVLGMMLWEAPPIAVGSAGAQAISGLLLLVGIAILSLGLVEHDPQQVALWWVLGIALLGLSLLPLLRTRRRSPLALYERGMLVGTDTTLLVRYDDISAVEECQQGARGRSRGGPDDLVLRITWGGGVVLIGPRSRAGGQDALVRDVTTVAALLRARAVPFVAPLSEQPAPPS